MSVQPREVFAGVAVAAMLRAATGFAAPLADFKEAVTDQSEGWTFVASTPAQDGKTFNAFEGYYADKGGKLLSAGIRLDKRSDESAYYQIRFDAQAPERAYQGVEFYDADGKLVADNYDVVYPGERQVYERVFYAMDKVESVRLFFQSAKGLRVWNLSLEKADAQAAAAYCDRVYATLPPLNFTAPADAMSLLPKTSAALASGKPFHVLLLGDSIMQDTFHSQFHALLKREFPKSNFKFTVSVRGSTGCAYYSRVDHFKTCVMDHHPDLLVIGGISNTGLKAGRDEERDRTVIGNATAEGVIAVATAAKELIGCEVLILTPALSVDLRMFDPNRPAAPIPAQFWNAEQSASCKKWFDLVGVKAYTDEQRVPLWDMTTPTYAWLYQSGLPYQWCSRDFVHSGERGKQIIGRALLEYFKAKTTTEVK